MNRRDFIKKAGVMGALTTWTVTCKYEEKEHDPKGEEGEVGETGYNWDYRVYCFERGQGEWTFSQNTRGSFAYQREYILEEDNPSPYAGWMNEGKLHFVTLEEAQDFVDSHVRAKDDTNLIDSIYDIYYVSRELDEKEVSSGEYKETEIQVAHYWFNGDTGKQIQWAANKHPRQLWTKIESG
tara:strand:- start:2381 stop:2926 length:546 start_codon:yes stop_codon:yes gene_type:complete